MCGEEGGHATVVLEMREVRRLWDAEGTARGEANEATVAGGLRRYRDEDETREATRRRAERREVTAPREGRGCAICRVVMSACVARIGDERRGEER